MSATCSTCKHWRQHADWWMPEAERTVRHTGQCQRYKEPGSLMWAGNEQIVTHQTFGCVQHEVKP